MDGGEQVQHIEKEAVKKLKRWLTNVGNVLFALWVRLSFQGSYWVADLIFYGVSGCFFVLHILFSRQLNKFN